MKVPWRGRTMTPNLKGSLTRFEWDGVTRTLGDVWTLTKTGWTLSCRLCAHQLGWEVRLLVGVRSFVEGVERIEMRLIDISCCASQWEWPGWNTANSSRTQQR